MTHFALPTATPSGFDQVGTPDPVTGVAGMVRGLYAAADAWDAAGTTLENVSEALVTDGNTLKRSWEGEAATRTLQELDKVVTSASKGSESFRQYAHNLRVLAAYIKKVRHILAELQNVWKLILIDVFVGLLALAFGFAVSELLEVALPLLDTLFEGLTDGGDVAAIGDTVDVGSVLSESDDFPTLTDDALSGLDLGKESVDPVDAPEPTLGDHDAAGVTEGDAADATSTTEEPTTEEPTPSPEQAETTANDEASQIPKATEETGRPNPDGELQTEQVSATSPKSLGVSLFDNTTNGFASSELQDGVTKRLDEDLGFQEGSGGSPWESFLESLGGGVVGVAFERAMTISSALGKGFEDALGRGERLPEADDLSLAPTASTEADDLGPAPAPITKGSTEPSTPAPGTDIPPLASTHPNDGGHSNEGPSPRTTTAGTRELGGDGTPPSESSGTNRYRQSNPAGRNRGAASSSAARGRSAHTSRSTTQPGRTTTGGTGGTGGDPPERRTPPSRGHYQDAPDPADEERLGTFISSLLHKIDLSRSVTPILREAREQPAARSALTDDSLYRSLVPRLTGHDEPPVGALRARGETTLADTVTDDRALYALRRGALRSLNAQSMRPRSNDLPDNFVFRSHSSGRRFSEILEEHKNNQLSRSPEWTRPEDVRGRLPREYNAHLFDQTIGAVSTSKGPVTWDMAAIMHVLGKHNSLAERASVTRIGEILQNPSRIKDGNDASDAVFLHDDPKTLHSVVIPVTFAQRPGRMKTLYIGNRLPQKLHRSREEKRDMLEAGGSTSFDEPPSQEFLEQIGALQLSGKTGGNLPPQERQSMLEGNWESEGARNSRLNGRPSARKDAPRSRQPTRDSGPEVQSPRTPVNPREPRWAQHSTPGSSREPEWQAQRSWRPRARRSGGEARQGSSPSTPSVGEDPRSPHQGGRRR